MAGEVLAGRNEMITVDAALSFARNCNAVATAKNWQDSRVYLTVKGNGGNYRGEQTAKIYIDLSSGKLVEQIGKGTTSNAWSDNVKVLRAAFAQTFKGGAA